MPTLSDIIGALSNRKLSVVAARKTLRLAVIQLLVPAKRVDFHAVPASIPSAPAQMIMRYTHSAPSPDFRGQAVARTYDLGMR